MLFYLLTKIFYYGNGSALRAVANVPVLRKLRRSHHSDKDMWSSLAVSEWQIISKVSQYNTSVVRAFVSTLSVLLALHFYQAVHLSEFLPNGPLSYHITATSLTTDRLLHEKIVVTSGLYTTVSCILSCSSTEHTTSYFFRLQSV